MTLMTNHIVEAAKEARRIIADVEEITGQTGLVEELIKFEEDADNALKEQTKSFDVGLAASLIGVIVSTVAFIHQIRARQIMKDRSRDEIAESIVSACLDHPDLAKAAKERIAALAVERLLPQTKAE